MPSRLNARRDVPTDSEVQLDLDVRKFEARVEDAPMKKQSAEK